MVLGGTAERHRHAGDYWVPAFAGTTELLVLSHITGKVSRTITAPA
jgi:hypothetical protein